MSKISLNVKTSYCPRWGLRQAVREVVQNARDCESRGGTAEYSHSGNTLTVTSTGGGILDERALVFGETSKADDDRAIGQFGDGLKVALVVFARMGIPVRIDTGRQFWTLSVEGGVVHVCTRNKPAAHWRDRVVVTVEGVTGHDWSEWSRDYLWLSPAKSATVTPWGRVLTDQAHAGTIYVQGILIERRPRYTLGYDLYRGSVEISRDREVVMSWQLEAVVRAMLGTMAKTPEHAPRIAALLSEGVEDLRGLSNPEATLGKAFCEAQAAAFRARHGDRAVPVLSSEEAAQAAQDGLTGVVVQESLHATLIAGGLRTLRAALAERVTEHRETFALDTLTDAERERLADVTSWFARALAEDDDEPRRTMPPVEIVAFHRETILGTHDGATGVVRLARRILSSTRETASTLIHEIAHRAGGDGTAEHRAEIERIAGLLAVARFGV